MARLDKIRDALDELALRLAKREIDEETYARRRALILGTVTPSDRAELGLTPTPTPRPGQPGSGIKLGPSGGPGGAVRSFIPSLVELDLAPGTVLFDQWTITRELGRGGFGAVFAAEELHLGEIHAVKVLDPAMVARDELLARFRREVSLMRKLVHPRIVRVFDYREDLTQHLALISMEYVEGCALRDVLALAKQRNQPIPVTFALTVLQQTLEALVQAHGQGVIHRDVTPGNILLAGGNAEQLLTGDRDPKVKLVDFGIAGLVEKSELSQKSRVLGTAAYVAPEVLDDTSDITPAADVYGAGAVVYELLTGKPPLVTGHEPARQLREELSEGASALVMACVAARPERRSGAAQALARLAPLLQDAIERQRQAQQRQSLEQALETALAAEDDAAVQKVLSQLEQANLASGAASGSPLVDRSRAYLEETQRQSAIRAARVSLGAAIAGTDETAAQQQVRALRTLLGSDAGADRDITEAERWLEGKEHERREAEARARVETERKKKEADERRRQEQQRRCEESPKGRPGSERVDPRQIHAKARTGNTQAPHTRLRVLAWGSLHLKYPDARDRSVLFGPAGVVLGTVSVCTLVAIAHRALEAFFNPALVSLFTLIATAIGGLGFGYFYCRLLTEYFVFPSATVRRERATRIGAFVFAFLVWGVCLGLTEIGGNTLAYGSLALTGLDTITFVLEIARAK